MLVYVLGSALSLLDERLFLPKEWIKDEQRSEVAGIPEEQMRYRGKVELALEMVKSALSRGIKFDWVGGDGLYGHSYEMGKELEQLDLLFVLDVHKDQKIYSTAPVIFIPQKQACRGRTPTQYQTTSVGQRVDAYEATLQDADWKKVKIRKTTKGWLKAYLHCKKVWVWDGEEEKARQRTLVIQ
ncbi:MAG: transposase [Bacteroidota bacterium]